jgi:uncharacterized protein (DUF927 family)
MDDFDEEQKLIRARKIQVVEKYKNELKEIYNFVAQRLEHSQSRFARDELLEHIKSLECIDITYKAKMEREYGESVEKTEYFSTTKDLLEV